MRVNEIRAMNDDQLKEQIAGLRKVLFELRFEVAAYKNPSPHRFQEARKTIARIMTIQREREHEQMAAALREVK